jgi:alpha-ketoglutarate-dependent taurine dioxygenase
MTTPLTVKPLPDAPFGAEISELVPEHITQAQHEQIWDAYREAKGLLCFSFGRLLEADELHALTAVFGANELSPGKVVGVGKGSSTEQAVASVEEQIAQIRARGEDPYMSIIGSVDPASQRSKPANDKFYGEWEWHTDMSYIEVPPTFSLLHAREIPGEGGDTGFCSQVMAAEQLPAALRQQIQGLRVKHDSTYGSSGKLRPGMSAPASPIEALGHAHPVIRKVPTTSEEAIYLGRRTNGYVQGMPLEQSEVLLDSLWAHATQPQFCYRHKWQTGQVVVWDNRMMLHMRQPMAASKTRIMWRTQTKGEAVVAA